MIDKIENGKKEKVLNVIIHLKQRRKCGYRFVFFIPTISLLANFIKKSIHVQSIACSLLDKFYTSFLSLILVLQRMKILRTG